MLSFLLYILSYRIAAGFLFSLLAFLILFKYFSPLIKQMQTTGQPIRAEGPKTHKSKKGVPTMGGVFLIVSFLISSAFLVNFNYYMVTGVLLNTLLFSLLGFVDDYMKIKHNNSKGLRGRLRLFCGFLISAGGLFFISLGFPAELSYAILIPYADYAVLYIGLLSFFVFNTFVITGTANAANLTDGLDGLLSKVSIVILVFLLFVCVIMASGNSFKYTSAITVDALYAQEVNEIMVMIACFLGSLVGFLWFNVHPAKIFMGDTGSLPVGAFIASCAIALKHELLLPIFAFVIFIEAVSVIIQVFVYKRTKKRVFKMAPLHHHFEQLGVPETEIVSKMFLVTIVVCFISLFFMDI